MRIPYSINPLTLKVYEPSPESKNLIGEEGIKIYAQELEWDNNEIPTLADLCVRKLAFYFEERPFYFEVPCADRDYLLELLSLDLPLEVVIPDITSEYYWRRRYDRHFGIILVPKPKGWNWKTLYIEREVQRMIESARPQYKDEERMADTLTIYAPFVRSLRISQLLMWRPGDDDEDIPDIWPIDHIDLTFIFQYLPLIEEIEIVYGMNNVTFDFCWDMFRVSVKDGQKLGEAVASLPNIKLLRIRKSRFENLQCKALMQGLIENHSLVELDMSNCYVGNQGALCISKFLSNHSSLRILNLSNNLIGALGAEGLAYAMMCETCPRLEVLIMDLNPLKRQGTVNIMRALVRNDFPIKLGLSAVQFEEDLPQRIPQALTVNNTLKVLDISSNWFGEEGGNYLIEAMEENTAIEWLDVRATGITSNQDYIIKSLLRRNRNQNREFDEDEEESIAEDEEKEGELDDDDL